MSEWNKYEGSEVLKNAFGKCDYLTISCKLFYNPDRKAINMGQQHVGSP
jgi:hypothetical protein